MTAQQYARLMGSGALAWAWQAHGFHYGVRSSYSAEVAAGRVVVVNGSREHIASQDRSAQVRVVQVLADQTALAERLHARGRDDPQAVSERLQRNQHFQDFVAHCHILNEGDLALAGQRLVDYLNEQLADTRG